MNTVEQVNEYPTSLRIRELLAKHEHRQANAPVVMIRGNALRENEYESLPMSIRRTTAQPQVELKRPNQKLIHSIINRREEMDPRYFEYRSARKSILLSKLKSSYADRKETPFWAIVVWTLSLLSLSPFMEITAASGAALLISFAWAGVHRARRI